MHQFQLPLVAAFHPETGMPIVALLVDGEPALAGGGINAEDASQLEQLNAKLATAINVALNEGCFSLQTAIGEDAGDFAGAYFSDTRKYEPLATVLRDYLLQEYQFFVSCR